MSKWIKITLALSLVAFAATACGSPKAEKKADDSQQPVTLTIYQSGAGISDDEFNRYFVDPVKKKFPNVTLKIIHESDKGNSKEEILASKSYPDIIYASNEGIAGFEELGFIDDLSSYIQKYLKE